MIICQTVVILLNYNGLEDTIQCVESLRCYAPPSTIIVIVDNASRPEQIPVSVADDQTIFLLRSDKNIGFGRGNNIGLRWAIENTNCSFLFILNNDTTIKEDTLNLLLGGFSADASIGAVCPRIVLMGDPTKIWYSGGEISWKRGSVSVVDYLGSADSEIALTPRFVTFASGCAIMVRREVIEKVGGFDPRYFMYEEDVELSIRITEAGYKIKYLPSSLLYHKAEGSLRANGEPVLLLHSPKNPKLPFYVYHLVHNRLLTVHKHAHGLEKWSFYSYFFPFWGYKLLQFAFYRRVDGIRAVLKAYFDYHQLSDQPYQDEVTHQVMR